jgi:DNA-binding transcriptional ArsR family regulator
MPRTSVSEMNLAELEKRALRACALLKAMSNPVRLIVLCQLAEGEKSVGELQKAANISQSALSQHLALLRHLGLVTFRRAGQTLFYSLEGPEAPRLLSALYQVYCSKIQQPRRRTPADANLS